MMGAPPVPILSPAGLDERRGLGRQRSQPFFPKFLLHMNENRNHVDAIIKEMSTKSVSWGNRPIFTLQAINPRLFSITVFSG